MDRAVSEAADTLTLLQNRLPDLPVATKEGAQSLLAKREQLLGRISTSKADAMVGIKTRYHGDYHLGQVLVTGNDFVIIDFEGEPARSFAERLTKSSPLRDVAGMLRSFNYARWSALRHVTQSAGELEQLDPAICDWELATREAFLTAYVNTIATDGVALPVNKDLLGLFELEKALYELRYELNNRPDWVQVPLQGILALLNTDPTTH
jgi:maltose alpha-D-glucosyltransferase/alpha-amylase